ncbi:4-coumarate--CoA ligase-like 9 isoform X2 [Macadamia integrifolia]|uniref:4-coumarate--CoA ligase-like 9 isoform X2 n=1 Tax=Macadamia integrifolia TaxID=60698 RepID=UPI001C4E6609|nr:4-coumarate--CoA ligase-like 9 isoform X2 [Macadamia integrifolia]
MMKETSLNLSIDPKSGFCSSTQIYHSLRPPVPLPPETIPFSAAAHALSFLRNTSLSPGNTTVLIDAATGHRFSHSQFIGRVKALSAYLQITSGLSRGDTAFILSPTSLQIPILYFSLLSIGVVISPANPASTKSEISHQIEISKPVIAFATSATVGNLPSFRHGTVLLDSPDFESMMRTTTTTTLGSELEPIEVDQLDSAAIMYSSGTTGQVKGVVLTHRNLIALIAGFTAPRPETVLLVTMPMFLIYGLLMCVRAVALAETMVLMESFDFEGMLRAIEAYKVSFMSLSPPLVVAMVKSEVVGKYDLSSLHGVVCGGAPLGKEIIERFVSRFPNLEIQQGYGLTESTGAGARMVGSEEAKRYGSVGRLVMNMEAKIVDPKSKDPLPPGQQGELWLRGPIIMRGYAGDAKATASTLDPEGWLKTGDLCYFDFDGFLFIVDRLKELIKYKAYQIPPAELEQLLQSHPEIIDAAVIPYPDEEGGQIPMAFTVKKPGSNLTEAQVMDFIAKQVAPYKKIRRVTFINSIPKTTSGKILRRELVNCALSGASDKQ